MGSRWRACAPYIALLIVAAALYAVALRIEVPPAGTGRIGPDVWPKAMIAFMALLCVFEIAKRLVFGPPTDWSGVAAAATGPDAGPDGVDGGEGKAALKLPMLLGGAAAIAGYVLAVEWLGFFASTLVFLVAFAWIGGFRRPGWNLAIAAGGSVLMMVLFMRVAYISLPLGAGPFRTLSLALLRLIGVS